MAAPTESGTKHLECRNLHGYLKTLPSAILDSLYNHPATCMAVFRELQESTEALAGLRIFQEHAMTGGIHGWLLNVKFRQNLQTALLGGGVPWTGAGVLSADKYAKDVGFLDSYAIERWECLLYFMAGSREGAEKVSPDVYQILLNSGLMKTDATGTEKYITPGGFQFLLLDTASQVWYFMLQYLKTVQVGCIINTKLPLCVNIVHSTSPVFPAGALKALVLGLMLPGHQLEKPHDSRGMNLVECLSFLFQLSFSTLGKDYPADGMNESQQQFLQHLREFGLVYQRKRKSQRYYPTRLAINLATGLTDNSTDAHRKGYIVVETNYRVYAYTDSPLQIALLGLFCEMKYRFPNLSVALLSRESVRTALAQGITAEQIINFLRTHAHEEMLQHKPIIPPTVTDEIRLWELERDRFKFSDGVMYNQFLSQTDFELLRNYADDLGVLVWEQPQKRVMIVTKNGHDSVKKFWKRQRNS